MVDDALRRVPVRSLREVHLAARAWADPDDFFWRVGVPCPAGVSAPGFAALATATWCGVDLSPADRTASVSFFAAAPERRAAIAALMRHEGLELLLGWIRALEDAPDTRRDAVHRLALYCDCGELGHAES